MIKSHSDWVSIDLFLLLLYKDTIDVAVLATSQNIANSVSFN